MGPFETLEQATGKPHSIILEKRGNWIAPGHNSVVTDAAGQDWMVYHAVDVRRPREKAGDEPNTRRIMLIDRIELDRRLAGDRWPVGHSAESARTLIRPTAVQLLERVRDFPRLDVQRKWTCKLWTRGSRDRA